MDDSREMTRWILKATLLVIVLLVFGRIVRHDWVEFDDTIHVTENPNFFPVTGSRLAAFWWRSYHHLYVPMSYMLYGAECVTTRWVDGDGPADAVRPWLFHTVSLFLHATSAMLVLRLLRGFATSDWASAAGAIVFAIHPLQVESVAWIAEQRGLLASMLSLAAIALFLRGIDREICVAIRWRAYALATALFGLALLSKPTAIVTPLVAFALALASRSPWIAAARSLVPWAIMAGWIAIITRLAQPPELTQFPVPYADRLLVVADAIRFYCIKLVVPLDLCVAYGRSPRVILGDPWAPLGALIVATGLLTVLLLTRCREWRLPISLLLIPLMPVLGFADFAFQNHSTVADRYTYMAMLGPAFAVTMFADRLPVQGKPTWIARGAGVAWLVGLATIATCQAATWRNVSTLAQQAARVAPENDLPWCLLATDALTRGSPHQARVFASRALHFSPHNNTALIVLAGASVRVGDRQTACDAFARLRSAGIPCRAIAASFYTAGLSHLHLGRNAEAAIDFGVALEHDPHNAWAANNLGVALARLDRLDESVAVFQKLLDTCPDFTPSWVGLGNTYFHRGEAAAAIEAYGRALALDPRDTSTLVNRAWAFLEVGDGTSAERDLAAVAALGHPPNQDLADAIARAHGRPSSAGRRGR